MVSVTENREDNSEGHSRRVIKGFLSMSGASLGVMTVQIGYAAITSRALGPDAFGAYAVALSGIGLIGTVGGSSLGQAAARDEHGSASGGGSLLGLSLMTGCLAALIGVLAASPWGRLWGVPESIQVTRALALSLPFASVAAVLAGRLRRDGRTHVVAVRTGIGQLVGMAIGLGFVLVAGEPWTLAVSTAAGAIITSALLAKVGRRPRPTSTLPQPSIRGDIAYGVKTSGINFLRAASGQSSRWAIGRFSGAEALGGFNRGTTLITVPLETLQRSFSYSLFPELRPGGPVFTRLHAFTDILILIAWPTLVLSTIGYFAAPPFVTMLLGPGWESATRVAGLAVLMGTAPMLSTPLGAAVEALGMFRVLVRAWACGVLVVAVGIAGTAVSGDARVAMAGMFGASIAAIIINGAALWRQGQIHLSRLSRSVAPIAGVQLIVGLGLALATMRPEATPAVSLSIVAGAGTLELGALWIIRDRTSFGSVARRHGLPGFQ